MQNNTFMEVPYFYILNHFNLKKLERPIFDEHLDSSQIVEKYRNPSASLNWQF